MRSGREQPLAPEQRDKPGAYCISTGQLRKSKGGDVKRVGASARRVNMTDRSSCQQDPVAPALGVVGGTPRWAVREIIPSFFSCAYDIHRWVERDTQLIERCRKVVWGTGQGLKRKKIGYSGSSTSNELCFPLLQVNLRKMIIYIGLTNLHNMARRGGSSSGLGGIVGIIGAIILVIVFVGTIFPELGKVTGQDTTLYSILLIIVLIALVAAAIISAFRR